MPENCFVQPLVFGQLERGRGRELLHADDLAFVIHEEYEGLAPLEAEHMSREPTHASDEAEDVLVSDSNDHVAEVAIGDAVLGTDHRFRGIAPWEIGVEMRPLVDDARDVAHHLSEHLLSRPSLRFCAVSEALTVARQCGQGLG